MLLLLVGMVAVEPGMASSTAPARAGAPAGTGAAAGAGAPTLAQLVGQKLMVAMSGTTPSADLLGRIERGEVGGVILFSFNIATPARCER